MFELLIHFVMRPVPHQGFHSAACPVFIGRERDYVLETIDSTFVSSVGAFVDRIERNMVEYTGSPRAIATVNGTAALHVALQLAGVRPGELVITQPLTFVATCNAIYYCGAESVFVDVDRHKRASGFHLLQDGRIKMRMRMGFVEQGLTIKLFVPV